ncbi:FMN-binding negative transcriptional regulator [Terrabacter terrigena]|uniref:FMN-binding negative transcriptional regulator n=1 Tax=Terrabacter terrigena TaxID=574718 RepID=A0ABW3MU84_9MICO
MYVPKDFVMAGPELHDFLDAQASAHLVTVGPDGRPDATLLPIIVDGDRVLGHLGRKNQQWARIAPGSPGLVVVSGAEAYISPSWYAAKAEHGRVVPTWNYTEVQLRGAVTVHDDPDWVLDVVTRLTERHESHRERRWHVGDAPEKYLRGQLLGIVGVEMVVESVEGKAKLGQNRSDADRAGAVDGLRQEPGVHSHVVADAMQATLGR